MQNKPSSLIHIAITANILEWYDFAISTFLAIVLGRLFFDGRNDFSALLKSFSVFSVSYLMRPFGSAVFGYLGNRQGSGIALRWATLLMAIPTLLIGLLPTYQEIGHTATVLLVILKLIQGFGAGGELPLSAYYVASQANTKTKGFMSALVPASGTFGMLLASLLTFLLSYLFSEQQIARWAWRIPFLLSAALLFVILKIRQRIQLDNGVPIIRSNQKRILIPINPSGFIRGALLVAAMEVGFYTLLVWLPNYVQISLRYSHSSAHLSNTLALGCYIVAMLTGGLLSGYIPYKKILMVCLSLAVLLVYPLFAALSQIQSFALLLSVQCLLALLYGNIFGVIMVILFDLFKDHGKNFGLAITFTLPTALFGGTAPLVCSYFAGHGHSLVFPAFYMALFGLLALPAAYGLKQEGQSYYAEVARGMRVIHQ